MAQILPTTADRGVSAKDQAAIARWRRAIDHDGAPLNMLVEALNEVIEQRGDEWWEKVVEEYLDALDGDPRYLSRLRLVGLFEHGPLEQVLQRLSAPPPRPRERPDLAEHVRIYVLAALGMCINCGAEGPFNRLVSDPFGQAGSEVHSHPSAIYCSACADAAQCDRDVAARHARERRALATLKQRLSAI